MEKKPNNEISELLARLQQKVSKKSAPGVDSVKPSGETPEELLDLLKKNIGAPQKNIETLDHSEYNIEGYEFEEEAEEFSVDEENEAVVFLDVEETDAEELVSETENIELEEKLRERVESLISESVSADETWTLPEKTATEIQTAIDAEDSAVSQNELVLEEQANEEVVCEEPSNVEALTSEKEIEEAEALLLEEDGTLSSEESVVQPEEELLTEPVEPLADEGILCSEDVSEDRSVFSQEEMQEREDSHAFEMLEEESADVASDESNGGNEYQDIYSDSAEVNRFFGRSSVEREVSEQKSVDMPDFDDIDINLALAFGSKEKLESSVGYERVRSARNGFYDPFFEESTGERTYGYER